MSKSDFNIFDHINSLLYILKRNYTVIHHLLYYANGILQGTQRKKSSNLVEKYLLFSSLLSLISMVKAILDLRLKQFKLNI